MILVTEEDLENAHKRAHQEYIEAQKQREKDPDYNKKYVWAGDKQKYIFRVDRGADSNMGSYTVTTIVTNNRT